MITTLTHAKLWIALTLALALAPTAARAAESCPLSHERGKNLENIVVLFEGHNGYSAALGEAFKQFQAREPYCTGNTVHFSDGTTGDLYALTNQFHALVANEAGGSPVAFKAMLMKGFCQNAGLSYANTEAFYFPETEGVDHAADCVQQYAGVAYAQDAEGHPLYPSVTILGYSNGGAQAIRLAQELASRGVEMDTGLTVDPVPQGLDGGLLIVNQYLGQSGSRDVKEFVAPPVNILWQNYWQEADNRLEDPGAFADRTREVKTHRGLHGNQVRSALNYPIDPPLDPMQPYPNGGHWRIFDSPLLQGEIAKALKRAQQSHLRRSR